MTDHQVKRSYSQVGKGAMLSVVRKLDPRRLSPAGDMDGSGAPTYKARSFSDMPTYGSIVKHREFADRFHIDNPFYKVHEGHSGATTIIDGKEHINFASYDYLGLNQHPKVSAAAKVAIDQYGTSVSASRIVAGERPLHRELEQEIAKFYGLDDAIIYVSGHGTNVSTIGELMGPGDMIIYDELIHNSALVGAQLSGAKSFTFRHNRLDQLEKVLRDNRGNYKNALIVVEGLYSMDGDYPDLPELIELKERYGAWLMVDEAHSLGVMGKTGRGLAEHFDIDPKKVDIWMGTLSKTLGACGGYITGSQELIEILKYHSSGFVYSVGMSPPVAAAALASLRVLQDEPDRVARVQANGKLFLEEAHAAGIDTMTSAGFAIVPAMVGDMLRAAKLTERLLERGINALPIIFPAVPMKAARTRFFITSEHTPEQLRETVKITAEELDALVKAKFGIEKAMLGLT
jgi:8-amino-7-oxononanoate synthase